VPYIHVGELNAVYACQHGISGILFSISAWSKYSDRELNAVYTYQCLQFSTFFCTRHVGAGLNAVDARARLRHACRELNAVCARLYWEGEEKRNENRKPGGI
jgi:hypothetical protein